MGFVVSGYPQGFVLLIFFYLLKDLIQNLLKLDLNLINLGNISLTLYRSDYMWKKTIILQ